MIDYKKIAQTYKLHTKVVSNNIRFSAFGIELKVQSANIFLSVGELGRVVLVRIVTKDGYPVIENNKMKTIIEEFFIEDIVSEGEKLHIKLIQPYIEEESNNDKVQKSNLEKGDKNI